MKKPLALLTILLGTILLATMSCNKGAAASALSGDPPVFTGGYDLRRNEYENSRRAISFIAATRERTREIRDFYSRWLRVEDGGSFSRSKTAGVSTSGSPSAFLRRELTSSRRRGGTPMALRVYPWRCCCEEMGGPIEVFLLLVPYHVVSNPTEPLMTARELEERLRNSR